MLYHVICLLHGIYHDLQVFNSLLLFIVLPSNVTSLRPEDLCASFSVLMPEFGPEPDAWQTGTQR